MGAYWAQAESETAQRRALVCYIQATLRGEAVNSYDIQTRSVPGRALVSVTRHLHLSEADEFFADAFARLHSAGPGIEGIAGCPFVVYYGEVSEDSDGPIELCRPVAEAPAAGSGDLASRIEAAHDEAFIRLPAKDLAWPALAPALDALEAWLRSSNRQPAAPPRQVLFADLRTAAPDTPAFDLSVPLR